MAAGAHYRFTVDVPVPAAPCLADLDRLGHLVLAARRAGGAPQIRGAPPTLVELVALAGFDEILPASDLSRAGGCPYVVDVWESELGAAPPVAVDALLRALPHALVAAVGDDGLFVDPPPSLPIEGRRVIEGARVATELVEQRSHQALIEAWEQAVATGASCVEVAIPAIDAPATMHLRDVRPEHGVLVLVLDAGEDPPPITAVEHPVTTASAKVVRVGKDAVAVIEHVDAAVTEVLGWRPDELVGRRSLDLIHPDDHGAAVNAWMDMLVARGLTTRARLRHARADGGWTWLDISNTNRLDDEGGGVDCEMVDVSEEVAAVDALHASEQLLRRLTDTLPVGVVHFDSERNVQLINPQMRKILGMPTHGVELVGLAADPITLDRAVEAVLDGADVDMEVDVHPLGSDEVRRCTLALRALTADGQITGAVGCLTDVTDSVRLREELRLRASIDELTGCLNRTSALEAVAAALGSDTDVAVVFVDVDDFKGVNDGHGHAAGDEVLQAVGARLRSAVRDHDAVGRMGGDEFIAVCTGLGSEGGARELAGRIAAALGDPVAFRRQRIETTASVGVAWVPAGEDVDADALVARADAAMYAAKWGERPF